VADSHEQTAASYDRVASIYAEQYRGELDHKPLDRALLTTLIELSGESGPMADIGCGPGHVARFLHDHGAMTIGIDLSAGMVDAARATHPEVEFRQGNMLDAAAGRRIVGSGRHLLRHHTICVPRRLVRHFGSSAAC